MDKKIQKQFLDELENEIKNIDAKRKTACVVNFPRKENYKDDCEVSRHFYSKNCIEVRFRRYAMSANAYCSLQGNKIEMFYNGLTEKYCLYNLNIPEDLFTDFNEKYIRPFLLENDFIFHRILLKVSERNMLSEEKTKLTRIYEAVSQI